jgi:hypothetical protein
MFQIEISDNEVYSLSLMNILHIKPFLRNLCKAGVTFGWHTPNLNLTTSGVNPKQHIWLESGTIADATWQTVMTFPLCFSCTSLREHKKQTLCSDGSGVAGFQKGGRQDKMWEISLHE